MAHLIRLMVDFIDKFPSREAGGKALAEATGIPWATVRQWLYSGETKRPSNERVSLVLRALGIPPDGDARKAVWSELGVEL